MPLLLWRRIIAKCPSAACIASLGSGSTRHFSNGSAPWPRTVPRRTRRCSDARRTPPSHHRPGRKVFSDWVSTAQQSPDLPQGYDALELGPRGLGYAARCGVLPVLRVLLEARVAPDGFVTRANKAVSPLMHAASADQVAAVGLLLEAKASPGFVNSKHSNAAHLAAMHSPKSLPLLLEAGAHPTARDMNAWGYLHTAAWAGHPDTVATLLQLRASPCDRDRWGHTPLFWAVEQSHRVVVALLAEAHRQRGKWALETPQKKHQARHGNAWTTPLHVAVAAGYSGEDEGWGMLTDLLAAGIPLGGRWQPEPSPFESVRHQLPTFTLLESPPNWLISAGKLITWGWQGCGRSYCSARSCWEAAMGGSAGHG
jgi:hypothetical protein